MLLRLNEGPAISTPSVVSAGRRLIYPQTVNDGAKRPFSSAVVLLFVVPLLAVAAVAYFVLKGEKSGVALAQGVSGGAFHPVAGNFEADDTELDSCGADYSCLQQGFGNVAYRKGAQAALELFDSEIEVNPHVKRDCHRIAHVIGSAAFAKYDGNVARTFALGSATCASGYYHGILERGFVGVNTKAKLVDVARELCAGVEFAAGGSSTTSASRARARAHDPDGVRPSARSLDVCAIGHALGRRRLHRRRVHGERHHPIRLSLAVACGR